MGIGERRPGYAPGRMAKVTGGRDDNGFMYSALAAAGSINPTIAEGKPHLHVRRGPEPDVVRRRLAHVACHHVATHMTRHELRREPLSHARNEWDEDG